MSRGEVDEALRRRGTDRVRDLLLPLFVVLTIVLMLLLSRQRRPPMIGAPHADCDADHAAAPTPRRDWYADPLGNHEVRYWDGWRWTEHVSDNGSPARSTRCRHSQGFAGLEAVGGHDARHREAAAEHPAL